MENKLVCEDQTSYSLVGMGNPSAVPSYRDIKRSPSKLGSPTPNAISLAKDVISYTLDKMVMLGV